MNDIIIICVTSFIVFCCFITCNYLLNKNDTTYLLSKNIKKLTKCIYFTLFVSEFNQVNFELTKTRLLKKYNRVKETICNMINLYYVDDKISNYYHEQVAKFDAIFEEIEKNLNQLSKLSNGGNYPLSQYGKTVFDEMNNKLNKQITEFIVGNAKFYTSLKFSKDGEKFVTLEEFKRKQKIKKTISHIVSFILSITISLIANYLSKLIGI